MDGCGGKKLMSCPHSSDPSASTTASTMSPSWVPVSTPVQVAPPSVERYAPDCAVESPKYAQSACRAGSGARPCPCRWPSKVCRTDQVAPESVDLQRLIGVLAVVKTWYSR